MPLGGAATPQPSTSENKLNLARLEESRGNFDNARKIYAELHQKEPTNAVSVHRLAVICLHLNQQEEADFYFRKAYALDSTNAELLADMGFAAFQKKDYAKSEEYLEQAARLDGTNSRTIENLAIARAWRGKDDASLTAFRQVHDEAEAVRRLNAIQVARTSTAPSLLPADQQIAKAPPISRTRIPAPTGAPPLKDFTMPPAPLVKEREAETIPVSIPVVAEALPTIPANHHSANESASRSQSGTSTEPARNQDRGSRRGIGRYKTKTTPPSQSLSLPRLSLPRKWPELPK